MPCRRTGKQANHGKLGLSKRQNVLRTSSLSLSILLTKTDRIEQFFDAILEVKDDRLNITSLMTKWAINPLTHAFNADPVYNGFTKPQIYDPKWRKTMKENVDESAKLSFASIFFRLAFFYLHFLSLFLFALAQYLKRGAKLFVKAFSFISFATWSHHLQNFSGNLAFSKNLFQLCIRTTNFQD